MDISHLLFSIFEIVFVKSQLENPIGWVWVLMDFEYLAVLWKLDISGHDCGDRIMYLKQKKKKVLNPNQFILLPKPNQSIKQCCDNIQYNTESK